MTVFTWDGGGVDDNWTTPNNWNQDSSYPQTNEDSVIFNATSDDDCTVDTTVTIGILDIQDGYDGTITMSNSLTIDDAGSYDGTLTITDPDAELDTGDEDLTVSGYTNIYGTLTPGASTCYFGYGNTASSKWDLGVRGTGVLNAGTGDWYTGGFGAYTGADVSLTSGIMYISGTAFGYLWSPDQGVGSWDNRDGTVILQKTGNIRTQDVDPLTASDGSICPFHNLIISGGADRTDAPDITLKRGLKVDNLLLIKNGVLQWDTYAGSYGDVWAVEGTELAGLASQSAAIVMDDMPARSAYYSATGSSPADDGMALGANAILSGAAGKIYAGNIHIGTDGDGSHSTANKAITGLNGSPYVTFPSGEACAVFWDGTRRTKNISMADDASLKPETAMTLCAWIKEDDITGTQRVIHKYDTNQGYLLSTDAGKIYWEIWIDEDGVPTRYDSFSHGNIVADTWTHIGITYDSVTGYLVEYQDGIALDTTDLGTAGYYIATGTKSFRLGNSANSLKGYMADARIYSVAKDGDDFAALAATNPATSVTGTYPSTGSGLVGWWKLQPTGSVNLAASPPRSIGTFWQRGDLTANGGELDITDSSAEGNDGTNNGAIPGWGSTNIYQRTSWISLRSYQRDLISNNTFGAGVEGRGSTMYIRPAIDTLAVGVADSGAENSNTNYAAGLAFKFNNFNICTPSAGNGILKSQSRNTGCGLLDITGDLSIASGSSLVVDAHSSISSRTDAIVGDIYVSGNCGVGGSLQCNDSTYVDALDDGYISRMPNLNIGNFWLTSGGTFNATPSVTTLSSINGNTGGSGRKWFSRTNGLQPGPRTFNANDGTIDCIGGVTCEYDTTDMFYNFFCSGNFETKNSMFHATNHFRTSAWGPNGTRGYNFAVRDFTLDGTFNSQTGWAGSTGSTYTVSGNARLSDGSKIYLSGGTGGAGHEGDLWYFKGNVINEGCQILGSGSW